MNPQGKLEVKGESRNDNTSFIIFCFFFYFFLAIPLPCFLPKSCRTEECSKKSEKGVLKLVAGGKPVIAVTLDGSY